MLVLSRYAGEEIIIGGLIRIVVTDICTGGPRHKVRIGIEAPKEISVHRKEIEAEIAAERRQQDSEAEPGLGDDFG